MLAGSNRRQEGAQALNVFGVLVEAESNPQHVATNVRHAVFRQKGLMPALRVRIAEGEKSRMGLVVQRVKQLGRCELGLSDRSDELCLKIRHVLRYTHSGQILRSQRPLNGIEAIQGGGIER